MHLHNPVTWTQPLTETTHHLPNVFILTDFKLDVIYDDWLYKIGCIDQLYNNTFIIFLNWIVTVWVCLVKFSFVLPLQMAEAEWVLFPLADNFHHWFFTLNYSIYLAVPPTIYLKLHLLFIANQLNHLPITFT